MKEFLTSGNWLVISLMVLQVLSLILMVERYVALYVNKKVGQHDAVTNLDTLKDDLLRSSRDNAVDPCAIYKITRAGLQEKASPKASLDSVQLVMDTLLVEEQISLEKRKGTLAVIGNLATVAGLLGTITGMIKAFAAVQSMNPAQKAEALSAGIGDAMYFTLYGLIVAVPALVAYAVFSNRVNVLADDLNKASLRVFIWISEFGKSGQLK